ncbi:glycosyltransferase [Corallococcus terminator]|nr:glycosyltransferase [Corallococcus terminator]
MMDAWVGRLSEWGLGASLCFLGGVQVGLALLFFWNQRFGVEARRWSGGVLVGVYGLAALLTVLVMGTARGLGPVLLGSLLVAVPLCGVLKHDSVVRSLYFTQRLMWLGLSNLLLWWWFQEDFPASASFARTLLFIPWFVGLVLMCFQTVHGLLVGTADLQPLMRRRFLRPTAPLPPRREPPFPKVTVHVPCHAEPPDVVNATLDAIARLDYPNFDVIVVDNNTVDPTLWRPVEAHCARLGARFRFIHVEALPGAKGGALNLALRHTPKATEVVAVLDADFVCEPDFLSRLVGFLDDPAIDYVQTPHDYRDWEGKRFQQASCWEERQGNRLGLPGLSEWGLTLLIGTTCLIRRSALDAVGGWSETSLTEDSELSLRLNARGGQGLFIGRTFGRGLLPVTFREFQKQRFRWTAGPIQTFKLHWRGLLFGRYPRMLPRAKRAAVFQALGVVANTVMDALWVFSLAGLLWLAFTRQSIPLPRGLLFLLGLAIIDFGMLFLLRRQLLRCSVKDLLAAAVANASLEHTRRRAAAAALFSRDPLPWLRTDKFQASRKGWRAALSSARSELSWGGALLGLAGMLFHLSDLSRPDLFLLGALQFALEGLRFLCAPYLALRADAELREGTQAALSPTMAPERPAGAAPATVAACHTGAESSPGASRPR